jgi:hypothetical protein
MMDPERRRRLDSAVFGWVFFHLGERYEIHLRVVDTTETVTFLVAGEDGSKTNQDTLKGCFALLGLEVLMGWPT